MKKDGVDIVIFGTGEPDFDTPPMIAEGGIQAIRSGKTRYTPAAGIPELRAAIAEKFRRENGLEYKPEHVVATAGAKQALHNAMQALICPGDEVILIAPFWVSLIELIRLSDGKPVIVRAGNDSHPDLNAIRKAIGPNTKGIIINSPNNPSGAVYTPQEIEAITKLAIEKNLWIISDEVYEKLVFSGSKFSSPAQLSPEAKSRTIVINAVSKTYAMTGWRLGYLAGPPEVMKVIENIQNHSTGNPSNPAQYAALTALTGDQSSIPPMLKEYEKRRAVIGKLLNEIPGFECPTPEGAFYAFPNVSAVLARKHKGQAVETSMRFSQLLLEESHVAVVPGSAFGTEGYLRFSYATSMQQIEEGMRRIKKFVEQLS